MSQHQPAERIAAAIDEVFQPLGYRRPATRAALRIAWAMSRGVPREAEMIQAVIDLGVVAGRLSRSAPHLRRRLAAIQQLTRFE